MRSSKILKLFVIGVALGVSACGAMEAARQVQEQKQQVFVHRVDMAHIWVTTEGPPAGKPFTELGELSYTEPFSPDAIEESKISDRLKKMAFEKWPDTIDAVVNENQSISADGSQITVTAKAIKFESYLAILIAAALLFFKKYNKEERVTLLVDLKKDPRLVYGMIFKNVGAAAGASLEHTHSQLIVTPIVPINVWEEMTGSLEFFNYRGRCVYCDMVQQELATEKRIVSDTPGFLAFCPFASRFPFETWILPKNHASHFENIQKNEVEELSGVMRNVIVKIEAALDQPAYNYIVHTAPFDTQELAHYHWHIEIMPSLTKTAGFEWGTGFYINPVPPEEAAAFLREVEVELPEPRTFSVA